jgi:beta-carotene 3-hydroxylase
MSWSYKLLLVVAAFIFMECVAWFTHKYIMHGMLWRWHEDHHNPKIHQTVQKNDRFFLVFAIPSFICYLLGSFLDSFNYLLFIGIGISLYGLCYFIIHDLYIHKRFYNFRIPSNNYLNAIHRAHGMHHSSKTKDHCESFGMLIVNRKFFKKRNKIRRDFPERVS